MFLNAVYCLGPRVILQKRASDLVGGQITSHFKTQSLFLALGGTSIVSFLDWTFPTSLDYPLPFHSIGRGLRLGISCDSDQLSFPCWNCQQTTYIDYCQIVSRNKNVYFVCGLGLCTVFKGILGKIYLNSDMFKLVSIPLAYYIWGLRCEHASAWISWSFHTVEQSFFPLP